MAEGGLHPSVDSPAMRRCFKNRRDDVWTQSIKHLVRLRNDNGRNFLKRLLFPLRGYITEPTSVQVHVEGHQYLVTLEPTSERRGTRGR